MLVKNKKIKMLRKDARKQKSNFPKDTVYVWGNQYRNGSSCFHNPLCAQGFPTNVGQIILCGAS